MVVYLQSKIKGAFEGWNPHTIYELKNGTKWMLSGHKHSSKSLNSPKAEILRDGDDYYLKVARIEKPEKVHRVE
ncbi:MAG: hypothetical protein HKN50_04395 [Gammaproteobacteria bacterium]|nr:hypothetical protein [Gammaproteobacteria bacterium]